MNNLRNISGIVLTFLQIYLKSNPKVLMVVVVNIIEAFSHFN